MYSTSISAGGRDRRVNTVIRHRASVQLLFTNHHEDRVVDEADVELKVAGVLFNRQGGPYFPSIRSPSHGPHPPRLAACLSYST